MNPKFRAHLFAAFELDYGRKTLTERLIETMKFDPADPPDVEEFFPPEDEGENPTPQHGDEE